MSRPLPNNYIHNLDISKKNSYNNNYYLHANNINVKSLNNPSNSFVQNINKSYNHISNNNRNNTKGLNTIIRKSTSSIGSGILIKSARAKKYNRVLKNGVKIKNIDINNDPENNNEDTESLSTNAIIKNKSSLSSGNIFNSRNRNDVQNKLTSSAQPIQNGSQLIRSTATSPPVKMNIFAQFINKILDKINPNINRSNNIFDPYNMDIEQQKTYVGELNTIPKTDTSKIMNNTNLANNVITNNKRDEINTKNNSKIITNNNKKQINQSTNEQIKLTQQNNYTKINQKIPSQVLKTPARSSSVGPSKSSIVPILNNQIEKALDKDKDKSYIVLNIRNSSDNIAKKEYDKKSKRSESKSSNINKFPFQPLKDILNSPKSKKSSNITNANTNTNTNLGPSTDNYLISHLGEHLDDSNNNKNNKGFKFCSELTQAGREANGNLKIDQDSPLISLSVGGIIGFNMFGVLDGHGPHGHFVSQYCKDYFIQNMIQYTKILKQTKLISTSEEIYNELKRNQFEFLIKLFNHVDIELSRQNTFDYIISGTTCNIIFQFNKHLVCCSVGDSRSILVYDKGDFTNQGIIPLSTDHKPNLPGEIERIQLCGGEVDTMRDNFGNCLGPARVYKLGYDFPGLAMSRSLGDFQAKEVGVISTPQIIEYDINPSTKFLVVCSDGVWEFVPNEQVRDLGNIFYAKNDASNFCTELVRYSMMLWEQRDINRDDITVVSVFF